MKKTKTKTQKLLWNEAIKKACDEIKFWDKIIPNERDRRFISDSIFERLSYKIKK